MLLRASPRALQGASAQNDRRGFVRLRHPLRQGFGGQELRRDEDRVAFRFPAKPLSACYPDLADGQRCSSSCTSQPNKKEKKSHAAELLTGTGWLPAMLRAA